MYFLPMILNICSQMSSSRYFLKLIYETVIFYRSNFDGMGAVYTVSQKKQDTKLVPITSPDINRFST